MLNTIMNYLGVAFIVFAAYYSLLSERERKNKPFVWIGGACCLLWPIALLCIAVFVLYIIFRTGVGKRSVV